MHNTTPTTHQPPSAPLAQSVLAIELYAAVLSGDHAALRAARTPSRVS